MFKCSFLLTAEQLHLCHDVADVWKDCNKLCFGVILSHATSLILSKFKLHFVPIAYYLLTTVLIGVNVDKVHHDNMVITVNSL